MIDEWKLDNMDKFIYSDYEGKHLEIDAFEDCFKKNYTFFKKKKKSFSLWAGTSTQTYAIYFASMFLFNWSTIQCHVEKNLSNDEICFEMKYIEHMIKKNK